jgi:hypothetical protein
VGVLLGNSDGTFQPPLTYNYSGGSPYSSIEIGDVNGDGKPDAIVADAGATSNSGSGLVGVLLGNGNGTFQPITSFSSGGYGALSVAVGDVNRDGKLDLVTANWCIDYLQCASANSTVGVLINITPSQYKAFVQPPMNSDGSSIFKANRGVIPVKFSLTKNNTPTCDLPPATIAVTRTAGATLGAVDEGTYSMAADNGSNFRIDPTACQYVYNLAASLLGVGTYRVGISINGGVVGNAVFALK